MPLRLRVISYKGAPSSTNLSATFNQCGGSIGRKNGNTLVLIDPENFVSGHHAEVLYQNGQYQLKDTSKNGTYLVNADINVTGQQITLQDKEILRIGEYEVLVEVEIESGDIPALDLAAIDRGPFSQSFATEPDSPFAYSSSPSVFEQQVEKPFPFQELGPSQPFQDSFSPPDVASANVHVIEAQEKDIAEFLKGLDSLSAASIIDPLVRGDNPGATTPAPFEVDDTSYSDQPVQDINADTDPQFNAQPQNLTPLAELSESASPVAPRPQPESTADSAELFSCFLRGAGISDSDFLPESQRRAAMIAAGKLFRNLIEGLMDVLRVRAEMKSEFRVSVTTIRSTENNPLKFNPDVESVLKLMLAPNNPAFIAPDAAVSEAFRDIKYHQMAVTAGIQASLAEILRRFEPEAFEKTLGEGLLFQKKARCWELYCEKYPELKTLAVEEFFGDEFADAYEKQMHLFSRR